MEGISLQKPGQDQPLLNDITLDVSAGEILGITGAAGNGLGELEDIISGFIQPSSGCILHDGEDITFMTTKELRHRGFAYVPADRLGRGGRS